MNYQDIAKANAEIKPLNLKGKDYSMVSDRVTAFRKLFPEGFITTDILSHDAGVVLMKATAGYYNTNGERVVLGTGFAQEEKGKGMVNGTSYIENCETSAVGRALGFIGIGDCGGGICSAEELVNAITAQGQNQKQRQEQPKPEQPKQKPRAAQQKAVAKSEPKPEPQPTSNPDPKPAPDLKQIPEQKPEAQPVTAFLKTAIRAIRETSGVSQKDISDAWNQLMTDGVVPFKSSSDFTQDEAETLVNALSDWFKPEGDRRNNESA